MDKCGIADDGYIVKMYLMVDLRVPVGRFSRKR